jgi:hypothetical protein
MQKTLDRELIMGVLAHPSIWPCIAPEGIKPEEFEPPFDCDYYITDDHNGLMIAHETPLGMLLHANFIPEARNKAVECARFAVNESLKKRDVAYALIPQNYPKVYQFSLRVGMQDGGLLNGEHFVYTNVPLRG